MQTEEAKEMKLAKTTQIKALGAGKAVTDEQLGQINQLALVPLTAEQVHVRRYLMAHNGIDRDRERFSEPLLDDFARTLPGKGFFVEGHPSSWGGKGGPGEGRYFSASTADMTPEEFTALTRETIALPEGVTSAKVLWGDAYLLKLDSNTDTLAKIDGGIYSFTSIGFSAPFSYVTDERGNELYGEYKSRGEALEGSLVWLGAQPGAGATKSKKTEVRTQNPDEGGIQKMKEFLKTLGTRLKKTFTEDNAVEEILGVIAEKDARIADLTPKAADGETYRKNLVEDVVRFGALIGEIPTEEATQKVEADFIATWPIERVKDLRDRHEAKARTKFPDKFTFQGKDQAARDGKNKEAEEKAATTTGRKDYTDPKQNELLGLVGK
ncbi:MAG: hypothetical protein WC291_01720 [Thermodesulfovibrionales bacterium]|jgi:hypothetical protein